MALFGHGAMSVASPEWSSDRTSLPASSAIPRELAASPVLIFARGIEHPLDVAVQRPHDADASEHRRAAQFCNQDQALNRGLPLDGVRFFSWKFGRVARCIEQVTGLRPEGSGIASSRFLPQPIE